jgi:myo-inositol-1(or 4)-monophosphatase
MLAPEQLANLALEVAAEAGTLVLGGYRKRPLPTAKARADLVTDFDLMSEQFIRERLARATPELGLVAEEGGGYVRSGLTWFCDPLDGTTNFVHGHPFWAVSIGLLDDGAPLAGAVVAPALGLSWWGYRGGAALRNGEHCRVSETRDLSDALVATGFPPNRDRAPHNNFDTFVRVKQQARGVRRCGSAAIDLCLVADGTYDAYWERQLHAWDCAAGTAVLLAAGGTLTSLDGGPPDLSVGHVLASNGHLHAALLSLITAT